MRIMYVPGSEIHVHSDYIVGTCSPGQLDPTGKRKEYLLSLSRDGKSFVNLPCEGTVRGYL